LAFSALRSAFSARASAAASKSVRCPNMSPCSGERSPEPSAARSGAVACVLRKCRRPTRRFRVAPSPLFALVRPSAKLKPPGDARGTVVRQMTLPFLAAPQSRNSRWPG
jgi:hypothetical protein